MQVLRRGGEIDAPPVTKKANRAVAGRRGEKTGCRDRRAVLLAWAVARRIGLPGGAVAEAPRAGAKAARERRCASWRRAVRSGGRRGRRLPADTVAWKGA